MDLSTIPPPEDAARGRLEAYVELLRRWAPRLDLVAPNDLARLWERHIEDSLRALPLLEGAPPGPCIDVGSGAGLPGIPLGIASGRHFRLLEPRRGRAAFLEEAVRALDLDAEVVVTTAEELGPGYLGVHAVATARALAPPDKAGEICAPLVTPGGQVVLWVGEGSRLPLNAVRTSQGLASITVQ